MTKLYILLFVFVFTASSFAFNNKMKDNRKIYPATPEMIQAIQAEITNDFAAIKTFSADKMLRVVDTDTLTEYYERTTTPRIFGITIENQTYPLVGTNPIYYFAGQKFYLPPEQLGKYVVQGILLPYGINFMLGTYKDTSLLWVYPINDEGLPTGEPAVANGRMLLAEADSNSKEIVYSYTEMDSSGILNSGFVFFVQTRHFDGQETDFVGLWANDQGDGNNESRSVLLAWDANNNQWMYANFSDLNLQMEDGNPPNFDVLILPVIAPSIPDAVDEPVTINGLTFNGLFPNPVKDYARLEFALETGSPLRIELVATNGALVKTIADDVFAAGSHTVEFNAADVPSGTYLLTFRSSTANFAVKALIVK